MNKIIENKVYQSLVGYLENLEHDGMYKGNGHHLAQKLSTLVAIGLLSKQKRIIYDCLTKQPKTTRQIADECGLMSKNVSAQLIQMNKSTLLIGLTYDGNIKKWCAYY